MTEPSPTGPTVRDLLSTLIEDSTEAADALECIARRGMTMDRDEIVRRVLASQRDHLKAAVRAAQLKEYLRKLAQDKITA